MNLFKDKEEKRKILFAPKTVTQEDIDRNLKEAFQKGKQLETFTRPKEAVQSTLPTYEPVQFEGKEIHREPQPSEKAIKQNGTWTASQWEDWAFVVYQSYPEFSGYLPRWFTDMIKQKEK